MWKLAALCFEEKQGAVFIQVWRLIDIYLMGIYLIGKENGITKKIQANL